MSSVYVSSFKSSKIVSGKSSQGDIGWGQKKYLAKLHEVIDEIILWSMSNNSLSNPTSKKWVGLARSFNLLSSIFTF